MARYSPEDKARAIEALRASAELVDGELVPRFMTVAEVKGLPTDKTLKKWWLARDKGQDSERVRDIQRARASEAGQGAASWLQHQHQACKAVAEYILDEMHRTGGPEQRIPPHQMARALKDLYPILADLDNALHGEGSRNHASKLYRLKEAARRVGLNKKKRDRSAGKK